MPVGKHNNGDDAVYTLRKTFFWSADDKHRAEVLAYRYNGSVSEVLRAGIRALEREHARIAGFPGDDEDDPRG